MSTFSLCVIGNSHAGAVWQAWKSGAVAARPGFTITVFASQASSVELDHRDRALFPLNPVVREMFAYTSGGKASVEIDDYDAFLLVGLGFTIDLARIFSRCSVVEHLGRSPVETLVSHACALEMIRDQSVKSMALELAKSIRADSAKPILIYPTPFRPESTIDEWNDPCLTDPALRECIVPRAMEDINRLANEQGCEVFWQHPDTISMPGLTKAAFAKGAVSLKRAIENDTKHVNPEFAALVLPQILERLGQAADPGTAPASLGQRKPEARVA